MSKSNLFLPLSLALTHPFYNLLAIFPQIFPSNLSSILYLASHLTYNPPVFCCYVLLQPYSKAENVLMKTSTHLHYITHYFGWVELWPIIHLLSLLSSGGGGLFRSNKNKSGLSTTGAGIKESEDRRQGPAGAVKWLFTFGLFSEFWDRA